MKRIGARLAVLLLILALLLGLTACGAAPAEPSPAPEVATPADETVLALSLIHISAPTRPLYSS